MYTAVHQIALTWEKHVNIVYLSVSTLVRGSRRVLVFLIVPSGKVLTVGVYTAG